MVISFCGCDEEEQKSHFDDDLFLNTKQIWGMIGTILATVACWVFYTKVTLTNLTYYTLL